MEDGVTWVWRPTPRATAAALARAWKLAMLAVPSADPIGLDWPFVILADAPRCLTVGKTRLMTLTKH
jgi:hypothetical protein